MFTGRVVIAHRLDEQRFLRLPRHNRRPRLPARHPTRPRVQCHPALALPFLRRVAVVAVVYEQRPDVRLEEGDARAIVGGEGQVMRGEEGEGENETLEWHRGVFAGGVGISRGRVCRKHRISLSFNESIANRISQCGIPFLNSES